MGSSRADMSDTFVRGGGVVESEGGTGAAMSTNVVLLLLQVVLLTLGPEWGVKGVASEQAI